ncbi:Phosphotransferase enzyme family protein [Tolypocladium capitatum]|uniref:Phosphotransferase enzyme family protein n=1 Tax=Tolypocladium capitatum TaxID=45235 RepID=A0A2K3QNW9_9HYPO|nr:Phosphotransferase enzyme family protein [Tolypocladium capitatum]
MVIDYLRKRPFIIIEFVNGIDLDELLKQPTENDQEEVILDLNIDKAKLDTVYDQIAIYFSYLGFGSRASELSLRTILQATRPLSGDP